VTDEKTLTRIRALGIPPAYTDVWICPLANGHLQATGRDARGRKQYRYHARWRETRDETKYGRMLAFADALPGIRARVEQDLARPGLGREKVLATIVRLLETTFIRVGNEEYARENNHFGLTTLHNEHVDVEGAKLHFHFTGKSGKEHEISVRDPRVARIVRKIQDLPGEELFQYVDAGTGERRAVHSHDVNEYLHEITGEHFTAKDFRTWAGTLLCALALREEEKIPASATEARKNVVAAIKTVAEQLGNTPAVCRKCYVHPAVLDKYLDGTIRETLAQQVEQQVAADPHALKPDEAAVMRLLREEVSAAEQAG
jgi:DNA topoisomerase-1